MTVSPKLAASPSTVVIDVEAGERSLTTIVEYWKEPEHAVWHRWRPGAWQRVKISVTDLDAPEMKHGYFWSPALEPGWVYEVSIWERGVDPNHLPNIDIPPRALASLTVFALRKKPEVRSFLIDETERTGGTYRQHYLVTSMPVMVRAAVGSQPPVRDANNMLSLPEIADEHVDAGLKASMDILLDTLLPGTFYHELVLLTDPFGNWEFVTRTFTTMKRQISVQLTGIHIHDDSDELSNGQAVFSFELQTGHVDDPNTWALREQASYANSNIESGKAVAPVPNEIVTVPYETVQGRHRHARFRVVATEDDSGSVPLDEEDIAWGMKDLFLPTGPDEQVQNRTDSVSAGPGHDGFHFDVSYSYSVDYA